MENAKEFADAAVLAAQSTRLPDVLTLKVLARFLGYKTTSGIRRAVLRGLFGSYTRCGRRILLRRDSLLRAIEAREVKPPEPLPAIPPADPEILRRLLHPRRGGGVR